MHRLRALIIVMILMIASSSTALGQDVSGTPEAPEAAAPKFALTAINGNDDGYFHDVEVQPGDSVELATVASNFGDVAVELDVFKVNAHASVNGGFAPGEYGEEPQGASRWIDLTEQQFSLEPGETREITFTVTVPEDASPGQYISGLMIRTSEPLPIPGTDSLNQLLAHVMSVGILVPGDIVHDFELGVPETGFSGTDRTLTIPIENTGNYLIRPSGEMTLRDANGDVVAESPIAMGSIYAGLDTTVALSLPGQLEAGEYSLDVSLNDEASSATANVEGITVSFADSADEEGVSVGTQDVSPIGDPITFADVQLVLVNGGEGIPATNIALVVALDGVEVEEYPVAVNQLILEGENQVSTRYLPTEGWQSGTYTFQIVVSAVDPNGGQETVLLEEDLDAEIVVP